MYVPAPRGYRWNSTFSAIQAMMRLRSTKQSRQRNAGSTSRSPKQPGSRQPRLSFCLPPPAVIWALRHSLPSPPVINRVISRVLGLVYQMQLLPVGNMLKITLHDSARELRLKLEGKLSGAWVRELRQCWSTAASATAGRRVVVDLNEVDFIDPDGQALLLDMHRQGVALQASRPFIRGLLQEIWDSVQYAVVESNTTRNRDAVLPARPPDHPRDV